MRSNYLLTEVAKSHDVDLLALNQSKLLEAYYSSKEEGLKDAERALSEFLGDLKFFEFGSSASDTKKRLLAISSLVSNLPYSVAWFTSVELAEAISVRVGSQRYDVVHFDTVGLAQYRSLVNGIPTVLDHHNIESHMMLRRAEKERNWLKKLYFCQEGYRLRRYEQKILPSFSGHITCSEVDSVRLLELSTNGLNVKAIPNSIRLDAEFQASAQASARGPTLLFIGGLDWYPNRDAISHFCREILPKISRIIPNVEVDIVGKNPPRELQDYARGASKVRIHGFVDDIKAFYRESDVFICPIRDGGGTKLKVLDAMAHYLPVVGYLEAWEGIDVKSGYDAMICETSDDFASAVVDLLTNRERARTMGYNGYQLIHNKYESQKVGEELSNFYIDIAKYS